MDMLTVTLKTSGVKVVLRYVSCIELSWVASQSSQFFWHSRLPITQWPLNFAEPDNELPLCFHQPELSLNTCCPIFPKLKIVFAKCSEKWVWQAATMLWCRLEPDISLPKSPTPLHPTHPNLPPLPIPPPIFVWATYGSDSPGRGFWPKCGIFLKKVEPSCNQTW